MQTVANPTETYLARLGRNKAYAQGLKQLKLPLSALKELQTTRDELTRFLEFVKDPANLERVQHERAGRIFWVLWTVVVLIALGFDSSFTFSSTAASLRDGLSRLLPFVSKGCDFYVALVLGATVLAITLSIRLSTETLKERERLNAIPADSSEIEDLLGSIKRKKAVRTGWAAVLTVLLATAAVSDLMTLRAYDEIASTTTAAKAGKPVEDNLALSSTAAHAQMLQLVTPYAVTAVLHFLVLFLPLPTSSPFLPYPCPPRRTEAGIRRVQRKIGFTGRQIYAIILAIPHEAARSQLIGILGEEERAAVNYGVGRPVFNGSCNGNGDLGRHP